MTLAPKTGQMHSVAAKLLNLSQSMSNWFDCRNACVFPEIMCSKYLHNWIAVKNSCKDVSFYGYFDLHHRGK